MSPVDMVLGPSATDRFPWLTILALGVDGLDRAVASIDVAALHRSIPALVKLLPDAIADMAEVAPWRIAYGNMGLKPSKYHSSLEALLRRVRKAPDRWLTGIRPVDLYNGFSIRYRATLGGYDRQKLPAIPLTIRAADPVSDHFAPLGAEPDRFPLDRRQIIYAAGDETACWALNHRDSRNFCLDPETSSALFCGEAVTPHQKTAAVLALRGLSEVLQAHGARCTSIVILDRNIRNKSVG